MASLAGITGTVPFTRIAGDLAVRDQHISSRQIHMDSSRGTLDLQGTCGFYGSLNYEGQFIAQLGAASSPASSPSGGDILSGILSGAAARNIAPAQITVPFALGGTLQQPQIHPGRTAAKFSRASLRK